MIKFISVKSILIILLCGLCISCSDRKTREELFCEKVLCSVKSFENVALKKQLKMHIDILKKTNKVIFLLSHDLDLLKYVIDCGGKYDIYDDSGLSLLHHAVINDDSSIVEYLLSLGISPNVRTTAGLKKYSQRNTPLMIAASFNSFESMSILLKYGADLSLKNAEGDSISHFLIKGYSSLDINPKIHKNNLIKLIKTGMLINSYNNCNMTLLDYVIQKNIIPEENYNDILSMLLSCGAKRYADL